MGIAECKVNGISVYEGMTVVVIYKDRARNIWFAEEGVVVDGVVTFDSDGPVPNQPYWIGVKYVSDVKTFPIRHQGKLNQKSRVSEIAVYLQDSQGGHAVTGSEKSSSSKEIPYDDEELYSGKKSLISGSGYVEEAYLRIYTEGIKPFNLLALDVNFRQYER